MNDEAATRRMKRARLAFIGLTAFGGVLGLAALITAINRDPTVTGVISGLLLGLLTALLLTGVGAWTAMTLMQAPKPKDTVVAPGDPLRGKFGDALDELEGVRRQVLAKVNARAAVRVPLGAAAGLGIYLLGLLDGDRFDLFDAAVMPAGAAFLGYLWASHKLSKDYARLYKERVLPALAAEFGEMTWRPAIAPDVDALKAERLVREFDYVTADDQLVGVHRGLKTQITELKLEAQSGKRRETTFDGLIVEVELPKRLSGVTAVIADAGAVGNFRDRMIGNGRQRVALEDPVFERVYEVYGSDQVVARALLHPAFMERMLQLGERGGYGRPLALARDSLLLIALPKQINRNQFEPPPFTRPAASREGLTRLRDDIAALLAAADAVIALESPARAQG